MGKSSGLIGLYVAVSSVAATATDFPKAFWMKVENEYRLGEIVVSESNERMFITCRASSYPLDEASLTPAGVGCPEDPFFSVAKVIKIDEVQSTITVTKENGVAQRVHVKNNEYIRYFELDGRVLLVQKKGFADEVEAYALAQKDYDVPVGRSGITLVDMPPDAVIGAEVVNERGDTVGEIADLVRSVEDSSVLAAVLSVGGFLGLGEKQVAVPVEFFDVTPDNRVVYADTTAEELKQMRAYQEGEYAPAHWDERAQGREPSG